MGEGTGRMPRRSLVRAAATVVPMTMAGRAAPSSTAPSSTAAAPARDDLRRLPARPASELLDFVGVNTHFNFADGAYGDTDRVIRWVTRLGVRHVRDKISPQPQVRHAFATLARRGVRVEGHTGTLAQHQTMDELLRGVAELYPHPGQVFSAFEGTNEPNNDGRPWIRETRARAVALHEARSRYRMTGIPIIAPALARVTHDGFEGATTAEQALNLGSLDRYVDFGNMHVYPRHQTPSDEIWKFRRFAREVAGRRPVVCSEGGYFTAMNHRGGAFPTPPAIQALYLPKMVMEHWIRGTRRMFVYELLDDPDPTQADRESNFGLITVTAKGGGGQTWRPKPAFTALRNLLRILEDDGPAHDVGGLRMRIKGPDDLRRVMFAKRNGARFLVVWRDVASYDAARRGLLTVAPARVIIRFGARRHVQIYDPLVSHRAVRQPGMVERVSLGLGDRLVVVRIR